MTNHIHTKLGEDRRVAIPAKLCSRFGLAVGDPIVLVEDGESLRIVPTARLLRDIQNAFAPYRVPGRSAVDELIAERRAEAAREAAEEAEQDAGRT